jgi:glutathione S-transferase
MLLAERPGSTYPAAKQKWEWSMIRIYAARWVPPIVQGLVRDIRLRWALEEADLDYEEVLLNREEWTSEAFRKYQPFNQIPVYEEDDLLLFESGAIVLHIARKTEKLLPADEAQQAQVISWMFAALNTMEPPIQTLTMMDLFSAGADWAKMRRQAAVQAVETKLDALARHLERRDYLTDRFSAADILMTTVLRIPRHCDLVAKRRVLDAYVRRCEARPAFRKALEAQIASFKANEPVPA